MDQEDIITVTRRNKMLIDSDEEQPQNGKAEEPTQPKIEKKAPRPEKPKLDRKKLKYLFEPDESATEESEESEEEESPEEKPQKKLKVEQPKKLKVVNVQPNKRDQVQVTSLEDLRLEVLKRWWYCLGDWPPADYDYDYQLNKYKLRKLDFASFKKESELDENGFRKVFEIQGYPGVFRTSAGDTLDLRPQDTCPSLENISKINPKQLPKLYHKGLKAQLADLRKHEPSNKQQQDELEIMIAKVQKKFQQYLE